MILKIYSKNPNIQDIVKVVNILKNGGVVILPTDAVYVFACNLSNTKGIEYISHLKKKDLRKFNLSFVCESLSQVSEYARMDDTSFKLLKENLPGPFTFLLNGSNKLPKLFKNKKEVGIRIPDHPVILEIIKELGNPLMVSSVFSDQDDMEYLTDPELIHETFGDLVEIVVDGGIGTYDFTTIIDCTGDEPEIIREGAGIV